jgi:GTPase Era involved in 16S rRNA processing
MNTTRVRALGVCTEEDVQILFYDTPGFVLADGDYKYERSLVTTAIDTMPFVAVSLLVVDSTKSLKNGSLDMLTRLVTQSAKAGTPTAVVLNKIDMVHQKEQLLLLATKLRAMVDRVESDAGIPGLQNPEPDLGAGEVGSEVGSEGECEYNEYVCAAPQLGSILPVYMISALHGDGAQLIKQDLMAAAAPSPWAYHSSILTDCSELARVTEIIREEVFMNLHQEIPYRLKQQNTGWTEFDDGALRIDQDLVVESNSQKGIVIGKGGGVLREISMRARIKLEAVFGKRVHLMLRVRVRR